MLADYCSLYLNFSHNDSCALRDIFNWTAVNGLLLNPAKTQNILICPNYDTDYFQNYNFQKEFISVFSMDKNVILTKHFAATNFEY